MDEWRIFLAIVTGAVIGLVAVVAVSLSLRLVGTRRLPWPVSAAIILVAIIGYGVIGYSNRPAPPPEAPPPQEAATAPAPTQIGIGGVALDFMPPAGYCIYPSPLLDTVIAHQAKINPDNVVHTVFGNCDQLREAGLAQTRIRDFGMLMTPKAQVNQTIDPPALERIIAGSVDPATVKQTLDQRLKDAQSRLKVQSFSSLGVLDREPGTAYFGYLFRSGTQEENFAQACIMAMTTLKGRLVSYYLYSDYTKDARAALLGLLQKAKSGVADFAARNS